MHLTSSNFTLFNFIFEVQNDKYGAIYIYIYNIILYVIYILNVSVILYIEVLLIKQHYTAMKLKYATPWKKSYDQHRQHI